MIWFAAIALTVLVASGIFIAAVLGILGFTLAELYSAFPLLPALGETSWTTSAEFNLLAVPLFILMGEILLRAGLTDRMYDALTPWLARLPGGVMHTNIVAAAMFASTSGSSVATAATISTVSLPNMTRQGYNPALFLGTLAAGGTLGILIPPSINMIIYGLIAEVSVADLYLAGIVPGLVLALMFSLFVALVCLIWPSLDRDGSGDDDAGGRRAGLVHLLPPLAIFLVVVGSIYAGIATASEAAALGVVAAIVLAVTKGRFDKQMLLTAFEGTMRTTCMVMLIVVMANFLIFVMSNIGLTDRIVDSLIGLGLSRYEMIFAIIVVYLLLGCFMDPISMMIATAPVIVPLVVKLGFNPVWFGVLFMVLTEAALITPPIGVNLFVVQSVRRDGPFRDLIVGATPFVLLMLLLIFLLVLIPDLALWLPQSTK